MICLGDSTVVRAAASSRARGRLSNRSHSSAIVASADIVARAQNSWTASGALSGGTGYSASPAMRSRSRLVTITCRLGHASSRATTSGAASTICSKLSRTSSRRWAPMWSASSSLASRAFAIVLLSRRGSRRTDNDTQKTPSSKPSLSRDAAAIASRDFPEPPGPVSVSRRPPSRRSPVTSAISASRPTNELVGRGNVEGGMARTTPPQPLAPNVFDPCGPGGLTPQCEPLRGGSSCAALRLYGDVGTSPPGSDGSAANAASQAAACHFKASRCSGRSRQAVASTHFNLAEASS